MKNVIIQIHPSATALPPPGRGGLDQIVLLFQAVDEPPDSGPGLPEPDNPPADKPATREIQIAVNGRPGSSVVAWDLDSSGPDGKSRVPDCPEMTKSLFLAIKDQLNQQSVRGRDGSKPRWAAVLSLPEITEMPAASSIGSSSRRLVDKARHYICMNLHRPVSMKETAAAVGVSMQHFCRVFKEKCGLPFKKYLARLRTAKAIELMQTTQKSLKEIAYEAGFGSIAQFNRQFRRWQGTCPTVFRASLAVAGRESTRQEADAEPQSKS